MPGTLIASGTGQDKSTGTVSISRSLSAGDSLIVGIAFDSSIALLTTMAWGATALTEIAAPASFGGLTSTRLFVLHNNAGGTNNITFTIDTAGAAMALTYQVWRGLLLTPNDKTANANSVGSTTPASGSTATTAQASELLIGLIMTEGPDGDTAGTWTNSFANSGRIGTTGGVDTTNRTVNIGFRLVSATGTYATGKTGITSRGWVALIYTFKLADNMAVTLPLATTASAAPAPTQAGEAAATLPLATAAATAPDPTATAGAVSAALPLATAAMDAPALTAADVGSITLPLATMAMAVPALAGAYNYMGTEANGILDNASISLTDGAESIAESRGIRSFGIPYFAMWMQQPGTFLAFNISAIAGGSGLLKTRTLYVLAAFHEPPTQIASADEPHYFFSYHEIGGAELFSIGVTPDMRLCARTYDGPILYSAPGLVVADGVARTYQLQLVQYAGSPGYRNRGLFVDDSYVAYDSRTGTVAYDDGLASPTALPTRIMAFNGVAGGSLLNCSIFAARFVASARQTNIVWPFAGGAPGSSPGYETQLGIGEPITPYTAEAYPGADLTLTAGFYDPRPAYPAIAGDFPSNVNTAYRRDLNTQYRRRNVVNPDYTLAGAP